MAMVVVVGAQWGDEGKGKVVDRLTAQADVVVRYGGGANAGHTLVVGGEKVVLRLIPSGALHAKAKCVLGPGVVIDPEVLVQEIATLRARGLFGEGRLLISDRAHVVMPHHATIDTLRENGPGAIGTTKRGIGPAYEDKAGRRGIRMADLLDPARFRERLEANLESWRPVIVALGGEVPSIDEIVKRYGELAKELAPHVGDASAALAEAREQGKHVLLEGAQGTMLDLDHGTFPFVTSSTVISGGACAGAGIAPTHIDRVMGITKAYTTRVGGGPFPTELHGDAGEALRKAGNEYGAVTGRPRRCGWLDIAVLRHAVRVNGISELAVTKLDVLSGLPKIALGVAYELDGKRIDFPPPNRLADVKPIYEELEGWSGDLSTCRSVDDLPASVRTYLRRIEELTGARVTMMGVGADREHTIEIDTPFRPR
ncbi:adenylosuccinate synthase [Sandaracinus amylolyticus]|uniref:adenylosuccinate synthase n=1 Tax=Sandaracinus amylolyticus TaxID=927083 RepID=UPI001F01B186|nr:adenylosuccinate synthase [Sandaracinus amylolyticus]UJR80937.1 Adenylosuccinate synthetase [Sandaracinus amylolyticus]